MMATAAPKAPANSVKKPVKKAPAGIVADPIADMLTLIRNSNAARHSEVRVPASRLKLEIARVLKDEGYIAGYDVEADGSTQTMRIIFKSRPDRTRVISGVKRISRPVRGGFFSGGLGRRRSAGPAGRPAAGPGPPTEGRNSRSGAAPGAGRAVG